MNDLQTELDVSWAVLGEVYGLQSHSGLNKLGMRIRRIKSNLDSKAEFASTVEYIPESISFETAGSDLLKLLVGPLYGNDISVGLRELVQNATDAVKELEQLISVGAISEPSSRPDIKGDVQVEFIPSEDDADLRHGDVKEIIVTDKGVGMSPDVVKNYFLRAGASLRTSDAWREKFERPDGTLKVRRSGRFGVGALAAFLLGDKITVETRHYSEPASNGLIFSAGIDTSAISVVRRECPVGTKICIEVPERLRKSVFQLLPSSYRRRVDYYHGISNYFGTHPRLSYVFNGKEIPWDKSCYLPSASDPFQDPWNFFETGEFEVNWSFYGRFPNISVNQIVVKGRRISRYIEHDHNIGMSTSLVNLPSLSIGDKSGSFPLNLQRDGVAYKELPFERELLTDITDELVFECVFQRKGHENEKLPAYKGLNTGTQWREKKHVWFRCSDGYILNNPLFLKDYNPEFALMRYGGVDDANGMQTLVNFLPRKAIAGHEANDPFSKRSFEMKGKLTRIIKGESPEFISQATKAENVYVPKAFVDTIREEMRPGREATKILNGLAKDVIDGWLVQEGNDLIEPEKVQQWRESLNNEGASASVVSLHRLSNANSRLKASNDSVIFDRWMELVGVPYIPNSESEIEMVLDRLKKKLGEKFDVFERRATEAARKR